MDPITVNSEEARRILGVSVSTLYRLRKSGAIKAKKINPKAKCPTWLYVVESLREFAKN